MLFLLKKYLGALLMPLPLLLLIGFIGLILLWFTRWQKSGKACVSMSLIVIALLGLQPISDSLLAPVEGNFDKRYELITENPPRMFTILSCSVVGLPIIQIGARVLTCSTIACLASLKVSVYT